MPQRRRLQVKSRERLRQVASSGVFIDVIGGSELEEAQGQSKKRSAVMRGSPGDPLEGTLRKIPFGEVCVCVCVIKLTLG